MLPWILPTYFALDVTRQWIVQSTDTLSFICDHQNWFHIYRLEVINVCMTDILTIRLIEIIYMYVNSYHSSECYRQNCLIHALQWSKEMVNTSLLRLMCLFYFIIQTLNFSNFHVLYCQSDGRVCIFGFYIWHASIM